MIIDRIEFYLIQFLFLDFAFHELHEQLQVHDFVQQDFYAVDRVSQAIETSK